MEKIEVFAGKAQVDVPIDETTRRFIEQLTDQPCLTVVTKKGLIGRKLIPDNWSVVKKGKDDSLFIRCRRTQSDKELDEIKRRKNEERKKR